MKKKKVYESQWKKPKGDVCEDGARDVNASVLSAAVAFLGDHTLQVLKKLRLQLVSLRNAIISNGKALRKDYM